MGPGALLGLALAAHPLTRAGALALADRQAPALVAARRGLPVAAAGADAAGAWPNPTLSVSVGPDDPRVYGAIDQRLPVFGQRAAAVAAAQAEVPVAQAQLDAERLALRVEVERAYAALAVAQAQLGASRDAEQTASDLAARAQRQVELGLAAALDVAQARLVARRAAQAQQDRQAALEAAQLHLEGLLGAPLDEPLEASDPLWPLPEPPPLDALLARLGAHPRVAQAQAERDAAGARAERERADRWPTPDLSLTVLQRDTSAGFGLRAGLAFDVPLWSRNAGAIAVQTAQAAQAEARGAAARQALAADLCAAQVRWSAARRRAAFFQTEQLPAAQQVFAQATAAYTLGRAPFVAVLQAQAELARTQAEGHDAAGEAWDALASLEEVAGASR
jgi:cobalt-zinc-cadmium efflux system outer membrane protein